MIRTEHYKLRFIIIFKHRQLYSSSTFYMKVFLTIFIMTFNTITYFFKTYKTFLFCLYKIKNFIKIRVFKFDFIPKCTRKMNPYIFSNRLISSFFIHINIMLIKTFK